MFGKKTDETLGRKFDIHLSSPYEQLCVAVAPACDWSTLKRVAQLLEVDRRAQLRCSPQHVHVSAKKIDHILQICDTGAGSIKGGLSTDVKRLF